MNTNIKNLPLDLAEIIKMDGKMKNNFSKNNNNITITNSSNSSLLTTTSNDSIYMHPTLADYYGNLNTFIISTIFVGCILVLINISIYCHTVIKFRKNLRQNLRGPTIFICSLYPLVSFAALTTLLLPKTWLICHTVMHLSFTVGAVVFRDLCFRYVDSEINYLKETDCAAVSINTPPCCCCCGCLPALMPSKVKLCTLRYMIYQMPFVQGCVMMVLNVIYYREKELYDNVSVFFIPFIVTSILVGLWGLNITVRMVNSLHSEYSLMKKMFCLQLVLLLCKLQYLILDSQLNHLVLGGDYPYNHTIFKQAIINLLILAEMCLVALLAQSAYTIPVENS